MKTNPWSLGLTLILASACTIDGDDDDDDGAGDASEGAHDDDGVDDDDDDDGDDGDDDGTAGDDGDDDGDGDDDAGDDDGTDDGGTDGGTDDGGTDDGTTGGAVTCEQYMGAATPEEVALTPRADAEAELLALEATMLVVAPEAAYERVREDLAAIREVAPEVSDISARASWDPEALVLEVDAATAESILAGTYDAWECPNELYRVETIDTSLLSSLPFVVLQFEGRYYVPGVLPDYTELTGVVGAEPDATIGDGDDVCLAIDGQEFTYVFDAGAGDCPVGCIEHTYWGFTVDGEGQVTELGTFTTGDDTPEWFTALESCTQWL